MKNIKTLLSCISFCVCAGSMYAISCSFNEENVNSSVTDLMAVEETVQAKSIRFKVINKPYAWEIQSVTYLGNKNGGYNVRISGIATNTITSISGSSSVNVGYYTNDGRQQLTGSYFFPAVRKGERFSTDIVVFLPSGLTISSIGGLVFSSRVDFSSLPETPKSNTSQETGDNRAPWDEGSATSTNDNIKYGEVASGKVLDNVDEPPLYPGGNKAYLMFKKERLRYPTIAQENGIQGEVKVQFTIDAEGKVKDISAYPDSLFYLKMASMSVVDALPDWKPAMRDGQSVEVKYELPFVFRLY